MEFTTEPSRAVSFLTAFLIPTLIASAMALSWPLLEPDPITLFLLAVVVAAWLGGLAPGLLAIAISFIVTDYLFVEPHYSLHISDFENVLRMSTAGGMVIFISGVCELLRRENLRAKRNTASATSSEHQFQTIANTIPQLAWMANADGSIHWCNKRWFDYTGSTPTEMAGWGWKSVQRPDVLPRVMEKWQAAIDTGTPFEMEVPLRRGDGKFHNFLTLVRPLKDDARKCCPVVRNEYRCRRNQADGGVAARTSSEVEFDSDGGLDRNVDLEPGSRRSDPIVTIELRKNIFADCDRRLARIVLVNLLGNASKFTRNTDYPRIEFDETKFERGSAFFVRDNGAGLTWPIRISFWRIPETS
jgi:PAS domain S-box-containing protein